jgi:hypothetical protein
MELGAHACRAQDHRTSDLPDTTLRARRQSGANGSPATRLSTVKPRERGSVMRVISSWWMRSNPAGRVGLTLGGLFIAGFAGMIGYILVVIAQGH